MKTLLALLFSVSLLPSLAGGWVLQPEQEKWVQEHLESGDLMGLVVVSVAGGTVEHKAYGRISADQFQSRGRESYQPDPASEWAGSGGAQALISAAIT